MMLRQTLLMKKGSRYLYKPCRAFSAKIFDSAEEAISDIQDGAHITMGGFGLCGIPENLIAALRKKGTKDLTLYSNDVGVDGHGIDQLLENSQLKKMV